MPRTRRLVTATGPVLAALAALVLAACGGGAQADAPDWKAQPSFHGEGPGISIAPVLPAHPTPSPSGAAPGPGPQSSPSSPSGSASSPERHTDPAVVATHLASPVGLTLLPDGTALVGERTTGRIVRVQPEPGKPVTTVRTLTGLSTAGGGGLLDLAVSPYYDEDGLIYAYVTTRRDNRVVAFTLTGAVTPVLTGIPKGAADNAGRLAFAANGDLYVGTGDAGDPAAGARAGLAGKVLRVSDIGKPAKNNPDPASPVFTTGHRDLAGVCVDPATGDVFEVEAGSAADPVNLLAPGAYYGAGHSRAQVPPLAHLPAADRGPGGCAVQRGTLYVTSLDGHALLAARIQAGSSGGVGLGAFKTSLVNDYGRLRTVVAAPDGALWLTTSNRDGHGKPVPADERVLRILPSSGSATDIA